LRAFAAVKVGVVEAEAALNEVSVLNFAAVQPGAVASESVNVIPRDEVTLDESVPEPVAVTVTVSPAMLSTRT